MLRARRYLFLLTCVYVLLFVMALNLLHIGVRPKVLIQKLNIIEESGSSAKEHKPKISHHASSHIRTAAYIHIVKERGVVIRNETSAHCTTNHYDIMPSFGSTSMDSNFRSPYHKYWEANCSAIFLKELFPLRAIKKLMDESRVNSVLPVPTDERFLNFTRDCSKFRKERKYPERPNSKEEKAYPLAYIIVTHKDVAQVERLLRAIYQPQNVYCIHPDKNSPEIFHEAFRSLVSCFDNVFIVSKVLRVQYGGFTRLQAEVNCMSDLLKKSVQWKYVLNLCGQDFPLKTNLEIVHQLKAYKGHNDINGILPPSYIVGRTKLRHLWNDKGELLPLQELKTPPPHNFTIYFGNAYYAATNAFANYVIHDQRAIDLLKWSNDTLSPDEHYWVTLQRYPGVPGGYPNGTWDSDVRFIKWSDVPTHPHCGSKYVRGVCVFGVGYLRYLLSQPYLFANKFYYNFDPVAIQCLEEMLDFRQRFPQTINQFVPKFPVTNLVWQNHSSDIDF